jgi:CspA family cold shock protein
MSDKRKSGRILRLKRDRGFGFIATQVGEELFFHASALKGTAFEDLGVGDKVSYLRVESDKGARALAVKVEESAGVDSD